MSRAYASHCWETPGEGLWKQAPFYWALAPASSVSPRHEAQGSDDARRCDSEPDGLQDDDPEFNQDVFHTSKASVVHGWCVSSESPMSRASAGLSQRPVRDYFGST